MPMAGIGMDLAEAAPPAQLAPSTLGPLSKAAIVVRLLIREGADIPLEDLPDELQARLTHQMGRMGHK